MVIIVDKLIILWTSKKNLEEVEQMEEQRKNQQRFQNKVNNAQGHFFEQFINGGCMYYKSKGIAVIEKMPEPFRVIKKDPTTNIATVRFTKTAQPDFIGTLKNGRAIVFEAKKTTTDRMKYDVLTETQIEALEKHWQAGAVTGVCAGIGDLSYFIPWEIWRDMKKLFKRKYMTAAEAEPWRVRFNGLILFLNYIHDEARLDNELIGYGK